LIRGCAYTGPVPDKRARPHCATPCSASLRPGSAPLRWAFLCRRHPLRLRLDFDATPPLCVAEQAPGPSRPSASGGPATCGTPSAHPGANNRPAQRQRADNATWRPVPTPKSAANIGVDPDRLMAHERYVARRHTRRRIRSQRPLPVRGTRVNARGAGGARSVSRPQWPRNLLSSNQKGVVSPKSRRSRSGWRRKGKPARNGAEPSPGEAQRSTAQRSAVRTGAFPATGPVEAEPRREPLVESVRWRRGTS